MKISKVLCALASVLALGPVASYAQQFANLARDANLRAGPSRDYPVVAELPAGMSVWVDGCINGYRWCDVTVGLDRGWIYAGNIIYPYQGARVPLLNYGAVIGIGIIAFSVGDYWDNHYRTRPWYPQRQNWINRPRPVLQPDGGHIRPFPTRPPIRPDGVPRPPHEQPPVGTPHPAPRPPLVSGQVLPKSRPAGETQAVPHVGPQDGAQRPAPAQTSAKKPRPAEGQSPNETQRPPHNQQHGGDKPQPWEELPGGGKK
jgi:uncharacterized protein YraI